MNNLFITNTELTISTREIAELTGKRHDNVMRVCRELKAKAISPQIEESEYLDSTGRKLPEFKLNKRDSLVLVARLSPEFIANVIDRWQELESERTSLKETLFSLYKIHSYLRTRDQ